MIVNLAVNSALTNPGSIKRANEDAFGQNSFCAFVLDGATGLGDKQQLPNEPSDAAWLARSAAKYMEETVGNSSSLPALLDTLCNQLRRKFFDTAHDTDIPRYAWPTASFAMLHLSNGGLTFAGLGDCTLYYESVSGVATLNPMHDFASLEADFAAHHLENAGGYGHQKNLLDDPGTLQTLRQIRSLQNTSQSGIWTLGLVPEAAEHLHMAPLEIPSQGHALLCSDGFSALVSDYGKYTPESMLRSAINTGLEPLVDELRHIETVEDPSGKTYPRFKQSDDATAMLVSWNS